jgi:hypothetical protein
MGRVGDRLAQLPGDLLDRTLALGQQVDDLGPAAAGQGLGHLGQALEQRILGGPLTHAADDPPLAERCQVVI